MATPTVPPIKSNNTLLLKKVDKKDLIAIAKGMKKDGFTDIEIARETKLSLSTIITLSK
ncbi:hypothetical protein H8S90_23700 [Olivibacter sp. SDN3]|uniref:hypothetical protein n=1 Tax=Olivibacter sp. SDN3 TaxID=2764720 RepID=UPI0016519EAB|nr:hypothetical protein [Olivibacter sp. SDN3]QNL49685.1 hypothetical protein H8S90_23700 [Olivibacter sp. SDN3]